eukprot:TRINITY_DN2696_c0_g1_i2.p2 TRINITY_DN2696_c0_g1~~TRINITY_DN2696_c0_g1_i2.p2  ORF type:complete len:113 (+),score=14.68 TRINITY_DN2696_c0_g1_i2:71-409(+)
MGEWLCGFVVGGALALCVLYTGSASVAVAFAACTIAYVARAQLVNRPPPPPTPVAGASQRASTWPTTAVAAAPQLAAAPQPQRPTTKPTRAAPRPAAAAVRLSNDHFSFSAA